MFSINPITDEDLKSDFSCGVEPLDRFFFDHALPNHQRHFGNTFVLRQDEGAPKVVGYYTLTMATVERDAALPRVLRQNAPKLHGAALLGRLAVDKRAQGQMRGKRMLLDAFEKCLHASELLGCSGIFTEAKDESASQFYKKHGFKPLDGATSWPLPMFIHIKTVAQLVRAVPK
ncbi:GNAT family N-acetyltransferase [Archangium gephyra]|uniref:GNAT family N-acetyltransferase n=1 Tax=Archangium gephyra TaxID=48 RepID=UPI003B8232C0